MNRRFDVAMEELGNNLEEWRFDPQPLEGNIGQRTLQCICTKYLSRGFHGCHPNGNQIIVGGNCLDKFKKLQKQKREQSRRVITELTKYEPIEEHNLTDYVKDIILKHLDTVYKMMNILNEYPLLSPIYKFILPELMDLCNKKGITVYECGHGCGKMTFHGYCNTCDQLEQKEANEIKLMMAVEDVEFDWWEETYGIMRFGTIYI